MEFRSDNFHDLYLDVLEAHAHAFEFINAPRGQEQKERLFTQLVLENPIERTCYAPERRVNIVFDYAEALWYLSGSDELAPIEYYASRMRRYSANGETLPGTAYGRKIFRFPAGEHIVDQWQMVADVLRTDSDSKRAVITILTPLEELRESNIDVSCTLSLQFLVRDDALHMVTTMRANDVYVGEVSDVFSFTLIHELMARELGYRVGEYHHQVASTHLYAPDYERAEALLVARKPFASYGLTFPPMPEGENMSHVLTVLATEAALRAGTPLRELGVEVTGLPAYWMDVVRLFELYRQKKRGEVLDVALVHAMHPTIAYLAYRYFGMES